MRVMNPRKRIWEGVKKGLPMISQSMLGLLAMGKMLIQQAQPDLFNIIDRGLLIDSDARVINIEANLSAEDIATLRELAEERVGEAMQGGIEG